MKTYEFKGLGTDWQFEAKDEEEATKLYIEDFSNGRYSTVEEYEKNLPEGVESDIYFYEIKHTRDER